jgi:hypothetical protein
MATNTPISPPGPDGLLDWVIAQPAAAVEAIKLLNKLATQELSIVRPGAANNGRLALLDSPETLLLALPLRFPNPVSPAPTYNAPTIGAYNTAQVQALAAQVATLTQSVNALTAQLRATGVNA